MSDPTTTARTARESLARGLNALQSDPNVPQHLLDLAQLIAQGMGALHQIERSGGAQLQPHAEVALTNVRSALSQLQAATGGHPAVTAAMEAVAGSLGLVHSLNKLSQGAAPPPQQQQAQPQQAFQPPRQQQAPQQAFQPAPQAAFQPPPQQAAFPAPRQDPFQAAAQAPRQQPAPAPAQAQARAPQPAAADPFKQAPAPQAAASSVGGPVPPLAGDPPAITADLGAHSTTNFYKGLSGNDIIDHGGLFVSTYMIPKIGTPVRLRVSLPGGYEFDANGIVRWSREQSDAGNDAPPGFGAQFTHITQEARQLVYRYVRNREPLFHDDL